jgi:hypothetical protein
VGEAVVIGAAVKPVAFGGGGDGGAALEKVVIGRTVCFVAA